MLRVLCCIAAMALAGNASAANVWTEADAKAPKIVRVGDTIELRLSENPSTGYVWNIAIDPPDAAAVVYNLWKANGGAIGATGTREISITIRQAGKLVIGAKNQRSWEGEPSVTKTLEFRIDAR